MGRRGVNGIGRYVPMCNAPRNNLSFTCAPYPYFLPRSNFSGYRVFQVDDEQDDEQSQLIQSQLGSFDDAKPYLDMFSCGITGMPQSPAPPPTPLSSSSALSALPVAAGMMHHHSSSYPSGVAAAAAKSHHHANVAAATVVGQQQSSRRSVSPASGGGGGPASAAVGSFKKPTVTSHAMARSSTSSGSSSSSAHFQPPANPPRYVHPPTAHRTRRWNYRDCGARIVRATIFKTVRGLLFRNYYMIFSHFPHSSITSGFLI